MLANFENLAHGRIAANEPPHPHLMPVVEPRKRRKTAPGCSVQSAHQCDADCSHHHFRLTHDGERLPETLAGLP